MPKLPFMLSQKDWEELTPKKIDDLGKRTDLSAEQQAFLDVFRVVDLRVEWACTRIVVIGNVVIVLSLLAIASAFVLISNPRAVELLLRLVPSP